MRGPGGELRPVLKHPGALLLLGLHLLWALGACASAILELRSFEGMASSEVFVLMLWYATGPFLLAWTIFRAWRSKRVAWVLVTPLAFAAGLGVASKTESLGTEWGFRLRHPSEAELVARFDQHRTDFDRLEEIVTEDFAPSLEPKTHHRPPPMYVESFSYGRLTKKRAEEYRRLFAELGVQCLSLLESPGDFECTVSIQGFAVHGSLRSFVHLPDEPSGIVASIDHLQSEDRVYRDLGEGWYLKSERW